MILFWFLNCCLLFKGSKQNFFQKSARFIIYSAAYRQKDFSVMILSVYRSPGFPDELNVIQDDSRKCLINIDRFSTKRENGDGMKVAYTPARTLFISGVESWKSWNYHFFLKNDGKKWHRLFILKFTEPLQIAVAQYKKYLLRMAKLAW